MDTEILKKLEEQDAKLEAIFQSVEKTRKHMMWTLIINVIFVLLPFLLLLLAIPSFLSLYSGLPDLGI